METSPHEILDILREDFYVFGATINRLVPLLV
jgi:hypothetical protein